MFFVTFKQNVSFTIDFCNKMWHYIIKGGDKMIGNILKQLRKSKGVSADEVSKVLGISRQGYTNYENEIREPNINNLIKLAEYFEVTVDYLLGREEQKFIEDISKVTDSELDKMLIQFFVELPEKSKQGFRDYLLSVARGIPEEMLRAKKDENKPAEEEPTLFIAASDGNPITEIDKGVIERLRNAPEIDPDEFDNL